MIFVSGKTKETVDSPIRLRALIDQHLNARKSFSLGTRASRRLEMAEMEGDFYRLLVHRGKKWEGWLSPRLAGRGEVQAIFASYFVCCDIPEERLRQAPVWQKVAGTNPLVFIIGGAALLAALIWHHYFR